MVLTGPLWPLRRLGEAWASARDTLHSAHRPSPPYRGLAGRYLLAAAAGLAKVAEELEGLLRGCAGGGRGGGGRVARAGHGCEGNCAEGPAVTALQDGDLQGAPGTPHLHREQGQSYHQLGTYGGPGPVLNTREQGLTGPS